MQNWGEQACHNAMRSCRRAVPELVEKIKQERFASWVRAGLKSPTLPSHESS